MLCKVLVACIYTFAVWLVRPSSHSYVCIYTIMSCDETTPGVAMMTNMTRLMMYNRWWSLWSCSSSLRRLLLGTLCCLVGSSSAAPVADPDRLLHLDTIAKMEQQKLRCMIELGVPAAGATAVSPAVDISLPMLDTEDHSVHAETRLGRVLQSVT